MTIPDPDLEAQEEEALETMGGEPMIIQNSKGDIVVLDTTGLSDDEIEQIEDELGTEEPEGDFIEEAQEEARVRMRLNAALDTSPKPKIMISLGEGQEQSLDDFISQKQEEFHESKTTPKTGTKEVKAGKFTFTLG